jgi:hypothetical protein
MQHAWSRYTVNYGIRKILIQRWCGTHHWNLNEFRRKFGQSAPHFLRKIRNKISYFRTTINQFFIIFLENCRIPKSIFRNLNLNFSLYTAILIEISPFFKSWSFPIHLLKISKRLKFIAAKHSLVEVKYLKNEDFIQIKSITPVYDTQTSQRFWILFLLAISFTNCDDSNIVPPPIIPNISLSRSVVN